MPCYLRVESCRSMTRRRVAGGRSRKWRQRRTPSDKLGNRRRTGILTNLLFCSFYWGVEVHWKSCPHMPPRNTYICTVGIVFLLSVYRYLKEYFIENLFSDPALALLSSSDSVSAMFLPTVVFLVEAYRQLKNKRISIIILLLKL